jgi:hypothetical protein
MGISQALDLCQEIMESILNNIPNVEVFLDDIGIFFTILYILTCALLPKASCTITVQWLYGQPFKMRMGVKDGLVRLTPTGLHPWSKKIQAIQQIQPPTDA